MVVTFERIIEDGFSIPLEYWLAATFVAVAILAIWLVSTDLEEKPKSLDDVNFDV